MSGSDSRSLRLRKLAKAYGGVSAVGEVDLHIEAGDFVTLLGPSGSGKTTTLKMIAGFEAPTSGTIELGGRDISVLSPAERGFGMVFQNYALFPHLTVAENIVYGLRLRKWSRQRRTDRLAEMLHLVQLDALADRHPHQLSGGQQQRVALARALAFGPPLLLMDEPLGALDRELRLQMERELRRLHRDLGTTVIYVTHDQDEALALSDKIAIMNSGRLVAFGPTSEVFEHPSSAFGARFLSRCNVFEATVANLNGGIAILESLGQAWHVDAPHGCNKGAVLRLALRRDSFSVTPVRGSGQVSGTVRSKIYRGDAVDLIIETSADATLLDVRLSVTDSAALESGSTVDLYVSNDAMMVLSSD